jgi:acetylornithine deacetylase/succinyl-diaminopimelate desuccinylase-like protein
MSFIENCRTLIGYDSSPGQSNLSMLSWLKTQAEKVDLLVEVQSTVFEQVEQGNIIIRPKGKRSESDFLLQTHLDTVNPGPFQAWKKTGYNPFDATIVDGTIFGLGVADAKLDFLCKLKALSEFSSRSEFKLSPVLVGTFGEQTGMAGAMRLIRKNLVNPRFALVGEPTNLNLVNATKGFACVEIRLPFSEDEIRYRQEHNLRESTSTQTQMFLGKATHSGNPDKGESAILKMLEYLENMPDGVAIMEIDGGTNYNTVPSHAMIEMDISPIATSVTGQIKKIYQALKKLEMEFREVKDVSFDPPHSTLNIGLIRTFEDHILMMGNCRLPPNVSQNTYMAWMDQLKLKCEEIGVTFRVLDYKKPFRTPPESVFLRGGLSLLREMQLADKAVSQPTTNESSLFARLGADCLCFGPGQREGNIHTPDEHVKIQDLHKATDFYMRMIERFCL